MKARARSRRIAAMPCRRPLAPSRLQVPLLALAAAGAVITAALPAAAQGFGCQSEDPEFDIGFVVTGAGRIVGLAYLFGDEELTLSGEEQERIDAMVADAEWRADGVRIDLVEPETGAAMLTVRAEQIWIDPGDTRDGAATIGLARVGQGPAFPVWCWGDSQGGALDPWKDRIRGP